MARDKRRLPGRGVEVHVQPERGRLRVVGGTLKEGATVVLAVGGWGLWGVGAITGLMKGAMQPPGCRHGLPFHTGTDQMFQTCSGGGWGEALGERDVMYDNNRVQNDTRNGNLPMVGDAFWGSQGRLGWRARLQKGRERQGMKQGRHCAWAPADHPRHVGSEHTQWCTPVHQCSRTNHGVVACEVSMNCMKSISRARHI